MENGKHEVFSLSMSKLAIKVIEEKLDEVSKKLGSAAKVEIVISFVLRNEKTGQLLCTREQNFV